MCSLFAIHYSFARIHSVLKVTPAMQTGLADMLYDLGWIVGLIDARVPEPTRPRIYGARTEGP